MAYTQIMMTRTVSPAGYLGMDNRVIADKEFHLKLFANVASNEDLSPRHIVCGVFLQKHMYIMNIQQK